MTLETSVCTRMSGSVRFLVKCSRPKNSLPQPSCNWKCQAGLNMLQSCQQPHAQTRGPQGHGNWGGQGTMRDARKILVGSRAGGGGGVRFPW